MLGRLLWKHVRRDNGQGIAEYGLILALLVVVVIGLLQVFDVF